MENTMTQPLAIFADEITKKGEGYAILLAYLRNVRDDLARTTDMMQDDPETASNELTPEEIMACLFFRQTGWFPASYHDTQEDIGMSFTRQTKYLKQLISSGEIEMSCSGRPARRLFRFLDKQKKKRNKK